MPIIRNLRGGTLDTSEFGASDWKRLPNRQYENNLNPGIIISRTAWEKEWGRFKGTDLNPYRLQKLNSLQPKEPPVTTKLGHTSYEFDIPEALQSVLPNQPNLPFVDLWIQENLSKDVSVRVLVKGIMPTRRPGEGTDKPAGEQFITAVTNRTASFFYGDTQANWNDGDEHKLSQFETITDVAIIYI